MLVIVKLVTNIRKDVLTAAYGLAQCDVNDIL